MPEVFLTWPYPSRKDRTSSHRSRVPRCEQATRAQRILKTKNVQALRAPQQRDTEKGIAPSRRGSFRNFEVVKIIRSRGERHFFRASSESLQHPEYSCSDPKLSSRRNTYLQRSYHKAPEEVERSDDQLHATLRL